jgi:hypothetical protein
VTATRESPGKGGRAKGKGRFELSFHEYTGAVCQQTHTDTTSSVDTRRKKRIPNEYSKNKKKNTKKAASYGSAGTATINKNNTRGKDTHAHAYTHNNTYMLKTSLIFFLVSKRTPKENQRDFFLKSTHTQR